MLASLGIYSCSPRRHHMATQSNTDQFFAGMKTVVRDIETGVGAEIRGPF
jgi:hypothetical protein